MKITFSENNLFSRSPINIFGHIEGLDLENLVSEVDSELVVFDRKTFHNNVTVDGCLYVNHLMNGFNLSLLCDYWQEGDNRNRNLVIKGL